MIILSSATILLLIYVVADSKENHCFIFLSYSHQQYSFFNLAGERERRSTIYKSFLTGRPLLRKVWWRRPLERITSSPSASTFLKKSITWWMLEKMETDERCVEEKCKDAQNFSHQLTIASLLSSSLSSGGSLFSGRSLVKVDKEKRHERP